MCYVMGMKKANFLLLHSLMQASNYIQLRRQNVQNQFIHAGTCYSIYLLHFNKDYPIGNESI
jgi:hypothetical protein